MARLDNIPLEHRPQTECNGCPFGGPKVGTKGNVCSPLVLVGESPGIREVVTGIPFSGPSGKLLYTYLPEDIDAYVINAMECSPRKQKNPKLLDYAARTCNSRLIRLVTAHPRRLIVAMGNAAVRSLTGDYNLKITQIRGQLIPSPYAELGILPVIHPAGLMHGSGSFRQFREDLGYAKQLALGEPPRQYERCTYTDMPIGLPNTNDPWWWTHEPWYSFLQTITATTEPSCDIETSGLDFIRDRILSLGVSNEEGKHVYCFGPEHLPFLKEWIEDPNKAWCWHNGKFDIKFIRQQGVHARVDDDTMLMSYALDEKTGVHDLETVAQDVLDAPDYKHMIKPYLPNKESSYELVPRPVLMDYMSIDVGNTARIRKVYRQKIKKDSALEKLYTKTLLPASELLARVESNGIYVDREWLDDLDDVLTERLTQIEEEINEICGRRVNPGSPKQMQDVLFRQFKLPDKKKGSTDKDVLKAFAENTATRLPIVLALREHRVVSKQYGTYVKGIRKWLHDNNRVYCTYLLHGSVTGRLASRKPNLQNIPRDPIVRGMFCAAPGCVLMECDLSQAELRSLAALSGDPAMMQVFLSGGDIHTELAIYLFGKDYSYEQRVKCKNVNFGIVYGITPFGLQDQIGGPLSDSERMINGWAKRFPKAWSFIQYCRESPTAGRTIVTPFGRKKRTGLVTAGNLKFLQNEAANFPHQSIASDITLHAAMRVEPILREKGIKIVNLIHDAILMEVPDTAEHIQFVKDLVPATMQQVPKDWGITLVPFKADAEINERWGKWDKKLLAMAEAT